MSFVLRGVPQMDIRLAKVNRHIDPNRVGGIMPNILNRTYVRFEPDDGPGAGRIATLCDGDPVEYIEEINDWFHVRSIIINRIRNIRHFDGWIRKRDAKLLENVSIR